MPKPENRKRISRPDLEQMSTDSLEKLLLDDYYAPEQGKMDAAELYLAAQILEERGSDRRSSADQAWEQFRKRYLPFALALSEEGVLPSSDDAHGRRSSPLRRWSSRAALAAALLCALVVLSVSVTAAASGFDFLKLLAQWTDEQIWLAPGQVAPADRDEIRVPEEPREYANLQEVLEDCNFTRPVLPQWLPEGFVPESVYFDKVGQVQLLSQAHYVRGEDNFVILIVIHLEREDGADGSMANFQKDEGDPVPYAAGGVTHLLSTNAGRPIAVWANGPAECAVTGDVTMEELRQIIDSIYA